MTQGTYPQARQNATKRLVELAKKRPLPVLLRAYHDAGWSQGRIAVELGVSRQAVNRWFREYGIRGEGDD